MYVYIYVYMYTYIDIHILIPFNFTKCPTIYIYISSSNASLLPKFCRGHAAADAGDLATTLAALRGHPAARAELRLGRAWGAWEKWPV